MIKLQPSTYRNFAIVLAIIAGSSIAERNRLKVGTVTVTKGSVEIVSPDRKSIQAKRGSSVFAGDKLFVAKGEKLWIKQGNGLGRQFFSGEHLIRYIESRQERELSQKLKNLPIAAKSRSTEGFLYPGEDAVSPSAFGVILTVPAETKVHAKLVHETTRRLIWEGEVSQSKSPMYRSASAETALRSWKLAGAIVLEVEGLTTSFTLASPEVELTLAKALKNTAELPEYERLLQQALAYSRATQFTSEAESLYLLSDATEINSSIRQRLGKLIASEYWPSLED